jgi:hypothetical protein
MNRLMKLARMALVSILFFGLVGASEYPFGSKVMPGDSDLGIPLFFLPAGTDVRYWETGLTTGYDDSDVVYLHIPGINPQVFVEANDVRLTPFGDLPAGSKVTPQDNDIGQPLLLLPGTPTSIRYLDLYGSARYDFMDPVYVHQQGSNPVNTVVRDVRLSNTEASEPGTKVRNFDPDLNKALGGNPVILQALPQGVTGPLARLRFFDTNGNGAYDYLDDVYLNFPGTAPVNPRVVVNNLRLSGPVC